MYVYVYMGKSLLGYIFPFQIVGKSFSIRIRFHLWVESYVGYDFNMGFCSVLYD
ncbi:hypothetical protein RchiOBHm_Chr3g0486061 [Rosa chinensis]|uniref:Uncharacterized protein n=1 Tax=Rosa chinensis TaxID=74649 RepID=A0A2P6RF54_ROSCH|nr:hypothetical protein RchiOBHm_Chr3g0486061 [Rosa chinensis]